MNKNRKTQKILASPKQHQKSVARPILARPLMQKKFYGPSYGRSNCNIP